MPRVIHVHPARGLRGRLIPPGDKSLSHRALLLAGMAQGESRLTRVLRAGVTEPMLRALTALGVTWRWDGDTLVVDSPGYQAWRAPSATLDCGHSGTTMRLLAGALAAAGLPAVLDGSLGLRRRPMRRVTEPLRKMGVPIRDTDGHAPLILDARPPTQPLRGGVFRLPVASAQVKTAILLAGLAASEPVTVIEPGPSRDHTERLLAGWGLQVDRPAGHQVTLTPPRGPLSPLALRLPGDISSAAFLIVAALITPDAHVVIEDVGLNPTRTGLLDALRAMGARLTVEPLGERYGEPWGRITASYTPDLHGITVRGDLVVRMIDEFPIFAVAATFAHGPTYVHDAQELRYKESDRIARLVHELRALGAAMNERPDGFVAYGGGLRGGTARAHGDHRLAMALTVAGLAAQGPVQVLGGEMYRESYPSFLADLQRLGASVGEEEVPTA
ncbi:MAG: 3-phosphoshikimate 1-carboxyvinyltransferase [Chloroflexi bacterium]|nr:3-phosphoshikimate 1-carboxyvinyltransferase [Chloroflexota bacterium]